MLPDTVLRAEIAKIFSVDPRSIDNFVAEGMPKAARGRYPVVACVAWYLDRERAAARASKGLNDLDLARQRKTAAEAQKVEMEVAKQRAQLITADAHVDVVGRVCDRLRAVLVNVPGNYGLKLERAGIEAEAAEQLLEELATELTVALLAVADDLEADDGDGTGADTAA